MEMIEADQCPSLLFRCYSASSAGRLESGKLLHGNDIKDLSYSTVLEEFENDRDPWNDKLTALVSTTDKLLRAVHLAFKKNSEGDDINEIEIVILDPSLRDGRLHLASELARDIGLFEEDSKLFQSQYVFEWLIPDACIVHRVTLAVLETRGFNIQALLGPEIPSKFPPIGDFRRLIANRLGTLTDFERGYSCGLAACCFGFRAPRNELARAIFEWTILEGSTYQGFPVNEGIEDAVLSHASSIGDALMEFGVDLDEARLQLETLQDAYTDNQGELVYELSEEPSTLQYLLEVEEGIDADAKAALEHQVAAVYIKIGY